MTSHAQKGRIDAAVMAEVDRYMKRAAWAAPADGLNPLQHARAHRAAMSPERRAELDAEWADIARDRAEDDRMVAEGEAGE